MSWFCDWSRRLFSHVFSHTAHEPQAPLSQSQTPSPGEADTVLILPTDLSSCSTSSFDSFPSLLSRPSLSTFRPSSPSASSSSLSPSSLSPSSSLSSFSPDDSSPLSTTLSTTSTTTISPALPPLAIPTLSSSSSPSSVALGVPKDSRSLHLFSLPDDILLEIMRHATHSRHDSPSYPPQRVVERDSYAASCAFAAVSQRAADLFYASLDNVSLASAAVTDRVVISLARRAGPALKRLVLRGSISVTNASLHALALHASHLRSLDLSFITDINSHGLASVCKSAGPRMRHLLLRKCCGVNDDALRAIAACVNLHTLDISYCQNISDVGLRYMVFSIGPSLRFFAVAHDIALTDASLISIGRHCKSLTQLCARGLPLVTDEGFYKLCAGIGDSIEGIDVTLCHSLSRDSTLRVLRTHCQHIYTHIMPTFATRSLRQIIISSLRQNIFIVHGSDPESGKDTVHTVLIDNGDLVSASLLSSGTTDLSMLGIVLCKSYGSALDEDTKHMLEENYGIPVSALAD